MNEQPLAHARASVMVYDAATKKWIPSGTSSGLSKVHIYHNVDNNTFRIVGRKIHDHEVVINCSILKGLKYFPASPTFHQWRDNSQIHGLNFATRDDAESFAMAMEQVLQILGHSHHRSPSQSHPMYQTIGHSGVSLDDYAEYRGWVNNENSERISTSEYGHSLVSNHVNHSSHPNTPGSTVSPGSYGHHRAVSAPSMPQQQLSVASHPPPQQPSPQSSIPPPPPPPPPTNATSSGTVTLPRLSNPKVHQNSAPPQSEEVSLAAALAAAKLKKTPQKPNEPANNETKHAPVMKGMASMLDEMTRTLARRRAQTDSTLDHDSSGSNESGKTWNRQNCANGYSPNKNSGSDSPQSLRRSESDGDSRGQLVDIVEVEKIKQDILVELKKEVNKMKLDIIDAIKMELNRR